VIAHPREEMSAEEFRRKYRTIPARRRIGPSVGEETLARDLALLSPLSSPLPAFLREYPFHVERRWRFDFAWPARKLAVEVEGVTYGDKGGRHQRAAGLEGDCEKYNAAVLLGWRVLRFTPRQIKRGEAIPVIEEALR
jgi:hypothetical protein